MRYLKNIYTICIRYVSAFDPQPAILLLCAGLLAFSKASETGANRPLSIIFPLIGVGFDQLDMGAIDQAAFPRLENSLLHSCQRLTAPVLAPNPAGPDGPRNRQAKNTACRVSISTPLRDAV
jgi:hypothetical protein